MILTQIQLKAICPAISEKNLLTYIPLLNAGFEKYQVNTKERISCFIAQVAHESGSFKYVKEIASGSAYEGRKDLGNINPGDGVKYKGRGLIQCTGRDNYQACSLYLFGGGKLLDRPEILEQPEFALKSAFWFWIKNKLNDICDKPDDWTKEFKNKTYSKFEWLTLRINGGQNGIAERKLFYEKARKVIV